MQDLNVTIFQTDLVWENIEANLANFDRLFGEVPPTSDLVVLPEMFSTGFTMRPKGLAEEMNGRTMQWLKGHATKLNVAIAGSLVIKEGEKYYNRLVFMRPDGTFDTYDKRHLFSMGSENLHYEAGSSRVVVEYKGWRILPLICYDLRFPVWSRYRGDYDMLLYVANWPTQRSLHWKTLLMGRAIENQCFTVGVNRIGVDANGNYHSGDSRVVSPLGEVFFENSHQSVVYTQVLSFQYLENIRKNLPFLKDRD
jgi:predicted amidohydrolase